MSASSAEGLQTRRGPVRWFDIAPERPEPPPSGATCPRRRQDAEHLTLGDTRPDRRFRTGFAAACNDLSRTRDTAGNGSSFGPPGICPGHRVGTQAGDSRYVYGSEPGKRE